ncbi:MAG: MATE family efflux transporter [Planctomycetia bacterium]|nr:MATE family efflux transporter [Planctomycetia bacterium]
MVKGCEEATIIEPFNPIIDGNIPCTLVKFAIPLMFAMFLQVLYGAADVFVVGLYADKAAISAIANGTQFMFVVMGFIMGLTVGGTVLIGVRVGEKNTDGVAQAIGTIGVLFGGMSLILTPFLAGFTGIFVSWMRVPAEAVDYCVHYIFICSLGIPFIIGYNVVSAIYRGLGDSKTPLIFVGIACILNIIVDFILIGGFRMSTMGAALATVLSQGISFFLAVLYMRKKGCGFQICRRHFTLNREVISKIIRVGLPLACQDCLVSISFMIIMIFVNTMGLVASASVGISGRIIGFCMIPPVSLAGAVATMTAQNMGAKKTRRAILSLRYGILFSLIFGVGTWTFFQLVPELATGIFTHDVDVRRGAALYLQSFTLDCILVSIIFSMNSYFSGCGKSFVCMIYSLASTFGIRVPAAYWISTLPSCTLYHLGFAAPAATLFSIVIAVIYFVYVQREISSPNVCKNDKNLEDMGNVGIA